MNIFKYIISILLYYIIYMLYVYNFIIYVTPDTVRLCILFVQFVLNTLKYITSRSSWILLPARYCLWSPVFL